MRIVLDLQGCQSVSRLRGIGRYSLALAKAIVRNAGDHEIWIVLNDLFPETVEGIRHSFSGLLPAGRIAVFSAPPLNIHRDIDDWRGRAAALVREYAVAELEPDLVHIGSLFEGYMDNAITSVKALGPELLTAVTLYDLIPFVNPGTYLRDDGVRKYYYDKIEGLKRADLLLAISEYCGEEAERELGIPRERIFNISSAVSESFRRLELSEPERHALNRRFGIERPFVMTTGIVEPRKNLEGLIAAYAMLPPELRRSYQLFMVCQATESNCTRLRELAESKGLAPDELVLAGYVSDDDLVALYNLCHLFVFPSLHEGFGLPALEAMACGAAVIGSSATSIPEVIGRDDALFDPLNLPQMSALMQRALSDTEFWRSLRAHAATQVEKFSWDSTGRRALRGFEDAFAHRRDGGDREGASCTSRSGSTLTPADVRYRTLIDAVTSLDLPASDVDYLATADAIAANQRVGRVPQLLVDVSVLCEHDAKSGIQRVTRAILLQLMKSPPAGWQVRPVRLDRGEARYRYANRFSRSLNDGARETVVGEDEWLDSQQGDVFLGLDLVADRIPQVQDWFAAQRRRGVRIYFVVYDLLPVLRPEWFHEGIAGCFPAWVRTIATVSDGLIGISRAVADDLHRWLDAASLARLNDLKLGYFHLGADIGSSQPSLGLAADADRILSELRANPTLLMVGTVEPRKGHAQALAAFEQLWAANVNVNLAIVGKAGWGLNGFADRLEQHPELNRHLFWLQGISDEYLEQVYGASSCLLAASFGEGFGLPLIEGAQKGLPIIARELPIFREVAGEHALYFDGDSAGVLAEAVQEWLNLSSAGRAPTSAGIPWLTWQQSGDQLKQVVFEDSWYEIWRPANRR
ncbi:glycosyltransferase involved in cell wall biosynthesis [Paraburkholderia sp. GAS448]|uniref:glycosyltransferase family 4 protein n=1 Tax=Paraburkholderia sp. GAS448 TaxID=3035136 RepID=UPI003D213540